MLRLKYVICTILEAHKGSSGSSSNNSSSGSAASTASPAQACSPFDANCPAHCASFDSKGCIVCTCPSKFDVTQCPRMFCVIQLGDNCIQNVHLERYIVVYTVGNLVLRRPASRAIKRDFRTYIRRYTSPNEDFEYGYPHSCAFLKFCLKLECCKPHKAEHHPTICDVINDVKLFLTVYRRI